jgi:hypothetical protein
VKTYQKLASLIILLASFINLSSQDIIITKDGEKHEVKIKEITDTVVKYNDYRDIGGIIFTMSRGLISEIQYEFGKIVVETEPVANELFFIDDKVNNLKFSFTALLSNVLSLTYERSLTPGSSIEATIKFQGISINDEVEDYSGYGFNLGYKLKFNNLFSAGQGYRPGHILSGGYIRPNAGFDIVNEDFVSFRDESYTMGNIGLDFGIQWVIQNSLSLEIFGGPHFYSRSLKDSQVDLGYSDPFANGEFFGVTSGLGASFGFRMGYVFGKKKQELPARKKRR